ncbi:sensor histidine kinase [Flavobacterium sp.]|uniref:tetratricopeptide repeat-containing sensor histidine kinase n=1 Tax=Flavobacterium sp. TaxID=239 RepID=UPI0025BEED50|nr:sensor histidine kinase [Flavobacterium sp.]
MERILLVLLFTACTNKKHKETEASNDSVAVYLTLANNDSVPIKKRFIYNSRAYDIIVERETDSLQTTQLFKVANRYYNLGDFPRYKKTTETIIKTTGSNRDTVNLAKAYVYLGDYYYKAQINDSAFYNYLKAEKIYKKLDDNINLGGVYITMARVKGFAYDYVGSELLITQALTLLRDSDDKQKIYEAYTILGYISNELKDYPKALEAHNKALELVNQYNLNNEFHQRAASLNNIGNVYQNENRNLEAIQQFEKALAEENLKGSRPDLYAIIIDNIAYSKLKLKDYKQLPNLFFEALKIRDSLNLTSSIIFSKIRISEYFSQINDTVNAKKYAFEALKDSKESLVSTDILQALKRSIKVDRKQTQKYTEEYLRIDDSVQQAERKIKDKFARIQFETEEISLQKDKLAEQNRNLLLFFVGTVMIGLLLFVIRTQRAKNRELMLKQAQQKANEDIYNLMLAQQNNIEEGRIKEKKRIAQELHDGVLSRLFGARLNLDSLNKVDGGDAMEKRNNYLTELKNIEQDIREISHDLNREKFVLINNFLAILNNLLEEQAANFEPEVETNIDENIPWDKINNTLKINLYRITQEALQNVNKYAQATKIKVSLLSDGNNITLEVTDNGLGFAVDKKSKGIGLQNMVSRAEECDGKLDIKSKKGKGTTISISFPTQSKPNTEQSQATIEPVIA